MAMKNAKKWTGVLLAVCMALTLLPTGALAVETVTTSETADFNKDSVAALELLTGGAEKRASWDADSKVLTLSGVDFTTSSQAAVVVPDGTTVVLSEGTENRLVSTCSARSGYSCGIACGEWKEVFSDQTGETSYVALLSGELTIQGGGTLYAQGGEIISEVKGCYSTGIAAHCLIILDGIITAKGGMGENEAYSVGLYTVYTGSGTALEHGDITISGGTVTASGQTQGIETYTGSLFVSGDAQLCAEGGVSVDTVNVSGGRLTTEGAFGIEANLNVTGGQVAAKGTIAGIRGSYESNTISGGTVTVEGGVLGACIFDEGDVLITGGELLCNGSFWSDRLIVNGGRIEAKATEGMPALGLCCLSKINFGSSRIESPKLGAGMELRYGDASGTYRTGVVCQKYEYDFYEQGKEIYILFVKAYSALFEADGTTLASSIQIAPISAEEVQDQISALTEMSTSDQVNETAALYTDMVAEEQAKVSVESIQALDQLVEQKNQLAVTSTTPEESGIEVSGLALASGVAKDFSIQKIELTVTDVTDTAQSAVAEALLELDFSMTVDHAAAQPAAPVVVSVPYTEAMKIQEERGGLRVLHLTDKGTQETVPHTLSADKSTLTFRASSFSGYAITGDPANTPVQVLTFLSGYRVQTPETLLGSCTLVTAGYDAQERMTEVHRYEDVAANEICLLSWSTDPALCRAFLLDARGRPLGAAAQCEGI